MKEVSLSGRIVAACVVVLTLAGSAAAQSSSDPVTFGVEVGVTFPGVNITPSEFSSSAKPSLLAGFYFAKPVATNLLIQPEFLFSQRRFKVNEGRGSTDDNFNFNYLEIPILARYNFPEAAAGGYAVVGPAISILLSAHEQFGSARSVDIKDEVVGNDVGIVIGAGYVYAEGKYAIEARYNRGFKELDPNPGRNDPSTKNKAFSIVFRLQFPRQ